MPRWPIWLYVFAAVMIGSWLFAAWNIVIISNELRRARRAGEAAGIPLASRGLPAVVIFTKNALPRVEKERRRLVYAISVFVGGWLIAFLLGPLLGNH